MRDTAKIRNNSKGVILIITLVILSLILVSVVTLSRVIISDLKMTLNIGNGMRAFYAADSAIESALFRIKYSRQTGDFTNFTNLASQTDVSVPNGGRGSYKYINSVLNEKGFEVHNISTSSPANVSILDPAGDINIINWGSGGNYTYNILWEIQSCFPNHASDRLEIEERSFGSKFGTPSLLTRVLVCNCTFGSDNCDSSISSFPLLANRFYQFSFKPVDDRVKNLKFDVIQTPGGPYGILSEASVEAQGKYSNSTYRMSVRLPSLVPISDIFSYVVFSEQDILKGSF